MKHDLNTPTGRANFLREISTDVTPNVNYSFKDRFIQGIRKEDYEAGIREGNLQIARKQFQQ